MIIIVMTDISFVYFLITIEIIMLDEATQEEASE